MKSFAHQILRQLKEEFPLPNQIQVSLHCYDRPVLTARFGFNTNGYVTKAPNYARIAVATKRPRTQVLRTVAHEYYHCIQEYVNNEPQSHPDLEPHATEFAKRYTYRYLMNINGKSIPEGYLMEGLPQMKALPDVSVAARFIHRVYDDDRYAACHE